MAPKKSQKAKAEEAEDVEAQPAPAKDKSKIPGGKAGGAASGQLGFILIFQRSALSFSISNIAGCDHVWKPH